MEFQSSLSGASAEKGDIRLRNFRQTDSDNVRELFVSAMIHGPNSPKFITLREMLYKPSAYAAYALMLGGLSITLGSDSHIKRAAGAGVSALVGSMFMGYRYLLSKSFVDYGDRCLVDDLADITSHYHMQPAGDGSADFVRSGLSGFWVVECRSPDENTTEIIGSIGLDCRYEDGVMIAELRRLCVSPYHRRRGIAALLVRTLLRHAIEHQISAVVLTTTSHQKQAIKMYTKLGWVETGRISIREGHRIIETVLINYRLDLTSYTVT